MTNKAPIKILLIEDDPDDALLIREILRRGPDASGLPQLESAETLTEGLARLEKGGVDLVLLDLSLPECRGIETLRRVVTAHPEVPVIVLTALNDEEIALEAVARGAQD